MANVSTKVFRSDGTPYMQDVELAEAVVGGDLTLDDAGDEVLRAYLRDVGYTVIAKGSDISDLINAVNDCGGAAYSDYSDAEAEIRSNFNGYMFDDWSDVVDAVAESGDLVEPSDDERNAAVPMGKFSLQLKEAGNGVHVQVLKNGQHVLTLLELTPDGVRRARYCSSAASPVKLQGKDGNNDCVVQLIGEDGLSTAAAKAEDTISALIVQLGATVMPLSDGRWMARNDNGGTHTADTLNAALKALEEATNAAQVTQGSADA